MGKRGDYPLFLFRMSPEIENILRDVDQQLIEMEVKRASGNTDNRDYEYSLVLERLKDELVLFERTRKNLGERIKLWVNS